MNKNTSLKRRTGEFQMYANTPEGYPLPIEFSMPFPQGYLWDIRNLRILCKETENPSQYRILNYWPDGSIKWVQGVARVSGEFQVLYNQGTSQTLPPIQVLQDGVNVLLKNEDTKLMIDTRNGTATFYKGKRVLSFHLSRLITPNGEEFYAKEAKVQVLEEGPIRSKVRLQGYHIDDNGEGFLKFDIFISLYSGVPIIEITHVLGVTHKDNSVNKNSEFFSFSSLDIPLICNEINEGWSLSEEGKRYRLLPGDYLSQWKDSTFEIFDTSNKVKDIGYRANGIMTFDTTDNKILVAIPEFWQQYPKGINLKKDSINIELFPRLDRPKKGRYADVEDEHKLYYHIRNDVYTLRQGVEKSHTLFIGFSDALEEAALVDSRVALPEPEYTLKTKAIGDFVPVYSRFKEWDAIVEKGLSQIMSLQEKERWYGMLNLGDWHGERIYNWGNLEYDDPAGLFKQGLRFQDARYFKQAVQGGKHYIDVDTISEHWDHNLIGQVWTHSTGHTGGYYPPGSFPLPQHDRLLAGASSSGHTRVEGISLMYLLTGDIRALEHVKKIADKLMRDPQWYPKGYYTAREPGWAMIGLIAAYDVTGSLSYLEGAETIADVVLESAEGKGVWYRPLEPTMCRYTDIPDHPQCHGEHGFMTAIQSIGMIRTYERTGRKDILENIITTAYYIIDNLYDPKIIGFVHSRCPLRIQARHVGGVSGFLWYPLAYAYRETGDDRFRQVLVDTLKKAEKEDRWLTDTPPLGKGFPSGILFMSDIQGLLNGLI